MWALTLPCCGTGSDCGVPVRADDPAVELISPAEPTLPDSGIATAPQRVLSSDEIPNPSHVAHASSAHVL